MKYQIALFSLLSFFSSSSSQTLNTTLANGSFLNTITTAVPFLSINPNAQSRGIGEIGVVSSEHYYESGLTQNPALLSRNKIVSGSKIAYLPWLRNLVQGMYIADFCMYHSIDSNNTFSYSYNRFDLGLIEFTNANGNSMGLFHPIESYHSVRYAHSFSEQLSIGIGTKYLASKFTPSLSVNSSAIDLGIDYRKTLLLSSNSSLRYNFGLSMCNIGPKVSYTSPVFFVGDFIPTTLKIGSMWTLKIKFPSNFNYEIDFAYQAEKLLVPSPPIYDASGAVAFGMDPNRSVFNALYSSFYDAPGGFQEELNEVIHMFGMENRIVLPRSFILSARTGVFLEHATKGNRKYLTLGTGINVLDVYVDIAYIVPFEQRHPLENTWNINLGYRTFLTKNNYLKNEN